MSVERRLIHRVYFLGLSLMCLLFIIFVYYLLFLSIVRIADFRVRA